jgi:hypothetical protein
MDVGLSRIRLPPVGRKLSPAPLSRCFCMSEALKEGIQKERREKVRPSRAAALPSRIPTSCSPSGAAGASV